MKFLGGITNSPLKEFWPMVHTSLPYYDKPPAQRRISESFFSNFWFSKRIFGTWNAPILMQFYMKAVPPVKIWSKTVILKRGYNIIFLYLYSEKTCFFQI